MKSVFLIIVTCKSPAQSFRSNFRIYCKYPLQLPTYLYYDSFNKAMYSDLAKSPSCSLPASTRAFYGPPIGLHSRPRLCPFQSSRNPITFALRLLALHRAVHVYSPLSSSSRKYLPYRVTVTSLVQHKCILYWFQFFWKQNVTCFLYFSFKVCPKILPLMRKPPTAPLPTLWRRASTSNHKLIWHIQYPINCWSLQCFLK